MITIGEFAPDFTYLEFKRNQGDLKEKDCCLSLPREKLSLFQQTFDEFIAETQKDDQEFGPSDDFFERNDYLNFSQVLKEGKTDYLQYIIHHYLFVEFFEKFLDSEGKNLITKIESIDISQENVLFLCKYVTRN